MRRAQRLRNREVFRAMRVPRETRWIARASCRRRFVPRNPPPMFFAAVRGASSEQQAEGRERWRRCRHKQACRSTVVNATVKHINAPQKVESNGSTYDDDVDGCGTNADSEATELVACLLAYSYVLQEFHSSDVPWLTSWLQKQRHIIYSLTHSLTASSNAQKSPGHSSGRAIHAIHHLPKKIHPTSSFLWCCSSSFALGY
ncbi:hypothetical protein IWX47DRAFT_420213 [Phyllosticta citricarpa]|uniref:Uncharacterized protein n=1 Tax=Phyllosticta citricarpa TaxID=55181 RepID=A0ABR1MR92_9PEZI